MNALLTKNFTAGGAIPVYRIAALSAAETVVQASGPTDVIIGVNDDVAPASGERTDIYVQGMVWIEAGGTVGLGDPVTSDSVGRAVTAGLAPVAGTRIVGYAFDAGVSGDLIRVLLTLVVQRAASITLTASGAIGANRIVRAGATGIGQIASAATQALLGVTSAAVADTVAFTLQVSGVVPVIAGAAITAGALVTTDAAGAAIPALPGASVIGRALADIASGAVGSILLLSQPAVTPGRIFTASGAIGANRIVRSTSTGIVQVATAATQALMGVAQVAVVDTGAVLLATSGEVQVIAGAAISQGALLTADSAGAAITATASAGSNIRIIGIAQADIASGAVGPMLLAPGSFQG
jgi:hypothetical protein